MLTLLVLLAAAPVDVTVPAALKAKTCPLELSGVTWVPALSRYLAVSDDTGLLDTASWHSPWFFTFDEKGVFDPAPVVIEGPDEGLRVIICEFPDRARALAFCASPEYAAIKPLRAGCAEVDMMIVDGLS